jgi:hypothetical protein
MILRQMAAPGGGFEKPNKRMQNDMFPNMPRHELREPRDRRDSNTITIVNLADVPVKRERK